MNRKKLLVLTILLMLAGVTAVQLAVFSGLRLAILPAEEGLNAGIYGFSDSLYGTVYSAKNPPEKQWELVNDDPHNYIFGYWHSYQVLLMTYNERTDVRIEVSQPWHEHYKEIKYWVDKGDEMVLIKGDIWIYHIDVTFSIVKKTAPGVYVFQDVPVWMALVTTVWDQAIQDPVTGKTGQAWGAPISVYVESWQVDEVGKGEHYKIEPSLEGRFITLYSEPSSAGATIDDLGLSRGQDLNMTLSAEHEDAPDSRMRSTAYMRFILEDFGITTYWNWLGQLTGRDYPSVRYKLKVYYLSLGRWTFTKDQAEEWEEREGEEERHEWWNPFAELAEWWANMNPFDKLAVFGFIGAVMIVVLIAVLSATGVLPVIIALIMSRRGNRG